MYAAAGWRRSFAGALALAGVVFGGIRHASTQEALDAYPSRAVRFIVSAPAGGGNDLIARLLSQRLQPIWKHPVIVENRPGAANSIAAEHVFRSAPDGHTFLMSPQSALVINSVLFKELRYDPQRLEPVSIASILPFVLVVNAKSPYQRFEDLVHDARTNPGKLNYGSQGNGSTGHLTGALFELLLGAKHGHVPYAGAAPALNDLVAGHIDFVFSDLATASALVRDGKLRILVVTSQKPLASWPEAPTAPSAGFPELLSDAVTVISAPPGTPLPIREKVAAAVRETVFAPDIRSRLEAASIIPAALDPTETSRYLDHEAVRWREIIRKAGVRLY